MAITAPIRSYTDQAIPRATWNPPRSVLRLRAAPEKRFRWIPSRKTKEFRSTFYINKKQNTYTETNSDDLRISQMYQIVSDMGNQKISNNIKHKRNLCPSPPMPSKRALAKPPRNTLGKCHPKVCNTRDTSDPKKPVILGKLSSNLLITCCKMASDASVNGLWPSFHNPTS